MQQETKDNNMNNSKIENGQPTLQPHNVVWRFRAYESEAHYEKDDFFFERMFNDHTKMKVFSSKHSYNNRQKYPEYCSMYWRVENAI